MNARKSKITVLFIIILFLVLIFIAAFAYRATDITRKTDYVDEHSKGNTALRGRIISADGFSLASSRKVYETKIDTRFLNNQNKELFIKLYSIYTGEDPAKIRSIIKRGRGTVTLSDNLDARTATYLRQLQSKNYVFFISRPKQNGKGLLLKGLDVLEKSQLREYTMLNAMAPIVGYINSEGKKKGIENFYDDYLSSSVDGKFEGSRDVRRNVVIHKTGDVKDRVDGYDVRLGVPLSLQVMIEGILDEQKQFLQAKEIVAAVMDSATGQIIALASSNRFNPGRIKQSEIRYLDAVVAEQPYEPGSIMKPFVFSLLLEHKEFNPFKLVNTHNGRYKLGRTTVVDTHPEPYLSAEDVIVYSSNIGMIELSDMLSGKELDDGLRKFGFGSLSGIDLPNEKVGVIPSPNQLNSKIYRGTVSYGYGLSVTFMQLLKAYNAFNNKGIEVRPHIAKTLLRGSLEYELDFSSQTQVLSQEVAKIMKRILIKTVEKGTGIKAKTPGIEVGGKTGTAHIAEGGGYANRYNGSFFGFANDAKGHRYTIGVWSKEPRKKGYYFGALAALPSFKKIVDVLVSQGYLIPSISSDEDAK